MNRSDEYLWWQRGVIYQVYPRSFADADGDGIGDLAGVIERLDYLADTLGVEAVWLSPIFPSPMADFGYDVSDYTGIDPIFGSLKDFDELLNQAHRRGLKIILDFVPNHSSDRHPWFLESRYSRDNPKRDWYIWTDPRPDGSLPNNWLSVFGGPAWEWDEQTGQYYLHSFLKEQPDLNWRNPEVKAAMLNVLRFWLERGVDGFRIDVAHFIMKDPELRDNPPMPDGIHLLHKAMGDYDTQVHINDQNHPDTHAVYREIRRLLDDYSADQPRVAIGEIHIFIWYMWASYYGEKLDELHMPFNFQLLKAPMQAAPVREIVDGLEASLPPGAWPNYVLGNHDESRLATRLGPENARLAAMLLLTLRGAPTLYYGDEIGMQDVPVPLDAQQDPWGIRVPGLGRDKCRTPMQWDDGPNAGFSQAPAGKTWLPLAENYRQVNVKRQLEQPESILNFYRRLLALRRSFPALQTGDYAPVDPAPADCFVYLRREPGAKTILVALNFSDEEKRLSLPGSNPGRLLLSTLLDREQQMVLRELILRGKEGILIELAGN